MHKALRYNLFLVECRAYDQLVRKCRNGHILPYCHGWVEIPREVEKRIVRDLARKGVLLEQPNPAQTALLGILFDYVEGQDLSTAGGGANLVEMIHQRVKDLHDCNITHGDLNTSNIRVTEAGEVVLLDLGSSMTFPHPTFCDNEELEKKQFEKRKEIDLYDLENLTDKNPRPKKTRRRDRWWRTAFTGRWPSRWLMPCLMIREGDADLTLMDIVKMEYDLYDYHLREINQNSNYGWLRNMFIASVSSSCVRAWHIA